MITRMILSKLWFLGGVAIVVCCSMLGVASADSLGGFDSSCPPAICSFSWDGMGPASGSADFTPAGYPWTFSFETAPALTEQCYEGGYCTYTYGYGGTFSLTGPDGGLTGVVTSGYALNSSSGAIVDVNFFGQWTDGSYWYGEADVMYVRDPAGELSASFGTQPTPEPSSLLLFGSGILGVARMFRIKRKS